MKPAHLCLALLLLLTSVTLHAQPQLTLQAGAGTWWPFASSGETASMTFSGWRLGTQSLGATMDFAPGRKVSFMPSASLELYRRGYQVSSFNWLETSDLRLLHLRLSPGVGLKLSKHLRLRAGMTLQIFGLGWGQFTIRTYGSGSDPDVVRDFSDQLGNQIQRFTLGPDLQFWGSIPLRNGGALTPGVTTYISLNRSLPRNSPFHYEPGIWQMGLQLGYTFPQAQDN